MTGEGKRVVLTMAWAVVATALVVCIGVVVHEWGEHAITGVIVCVAVLVVLAYAIGTYVAKESEQERWMEEDQEDW